MNIVLTHKLCYNTCVAQASTKKYKTGDRIVEAGRVFRIFKVRNRENGDGEEQRVIFFKPQYKKNQSPLVCSIPAENADDARIRKPLTKKEFKKIFKILGKKAKKSVKVNTSSLKDKLNKNKPKLTAKVLRKLWIDKHNDNTSFSPTKKRVYRKALRNLSEELAWVNDSSVRKARKKIKKELEKALPDEPEEE